MENIQQLCKVRYSSTQNTGTEEKGTPSMINKQRGKICLKPQSRQVSWIRDTASWQRLRDILRTPHASLEAHCIAQFNTSTCVSAARISWCVYLCSGTNPVKGGVWCQRISQTPFDSQEQLYLNKAKILWENPSNLLIPISVFGLRDSSILLICFCLSEAAGGF